jgi:hypothetical protein
MIYNLLRTEGYLGNVGLSFSYVFLRARLRARYLLGDPRAFRELRLDIVIQGCAMSENKDTRPARPLTPKEAAGFWP